MSATDVTIPHALRSDVAEFASRYYPQVTEAYESRDEYSGWLRPVIEWIQEAVEAYEWEYLEKGGSRFIIKIPEAVGDTYSGPALVLKVPIVWGDSRDGRYQNAAEANLWREAPDELRPYLVPVLAAGHLYRWVLMPYAESTDYETVKPRAQELMHNQGIVSNEMVAAQNWGIWDGEPRLIDYGHDISQFVLDAEEQVAVEEYAPEIPASYEDDEDEAANADDGIEGGDGQSVDGPVAAQVVLDGSGLRPAEKHEVRGKMPGQGVAAGQDVEFDEMVVEVLATRPSTGTAFGVEVAVADEETHIRFK